MFWKLNFKTPCLFHSSSFHPCEVESKEYDIQKQLCTLYKLGSLHTYPDIGQAPERREKTSRLHLTLILGAETAYNSIKQTPNTFNSSQTAEEMARQVKSLIHKQRPEFLFLPPKWKLGVEPETQCWRRVGQMPRACWRKFRDQWEACLRNQGGKWQRKKPDPDLYTHAHTNSVAKMDRTGR